MEPQASSKQTKEPTESPFPTGEEQQGNPSGAAESPPVANDVVGRIAQSAHSTIDRIASQAAPVADRLQQNLGGAGEKLHQRVDDVRQSGEEWMKSLRCTVRDHPLAAVGTAMLLGMLIVRLSR